MWILELSPCFLPHPPKLQFAPHQQLMSVIDNNLPWRNVVDHLWFKRYVLETYTTVFIPLKCSASQFQNRSIDWFVVRLRLILRKRAWGCAIHLGFTNWAINLMTTWSIKRGDRGSAIRPHRLRRQIDDRCCLLFPVVHIPQTHPKNRKHTLTYSICVVNLVWDYCNNTVEYSTSGWE